MSNHRRCGLNTILLSWVCFPEYVEGKDPDLLCICPGRLGLARVIQCSVVSYMSDTIRCCLSEVTYLSLPVTVMCPVVAGMHSE